MIACAHGCGSLMHIKCLPTYSSPNASISCENCKTKPPGGAQAMILKRIADLANIVLAQNNQLNVELGAVREELRKCKTELNEELQWCKNELREAKSKILTLSPTPQTSAFNFGAKTGSTFSGPSSEGTGPFRIPAASAFVDNPPRSRSNSVKRKRIEVGRENKQPLIGTGDSSAVMIPVIKKVVKKRVFVSRIAPNFTPADLHRALRPRLSSSLSVSRLHTTHDSYSSFCLFVTETDEKVVLNSDFWPPGTVIKPYFGRLSPDRIHSTFNEASSETTDSSTEQNDLGSHQGNSVEIRVEKEVIG